jgi:myosin heavy chain 6/7
LELSETLKKEFKNKPYDAKKSCWVPVKETGGFIKGQVESYQGDKVTIKLSDDEVRN